MGTLIGLDEPADQATGDRVRSDPLVHRDRIVGVLRQARRGRVGHGVREVVSAHVGYLPAASRPTRPAGVRGRAGPGREAQYPVRTATPLTRPAARSRSARSASANGYGVTATS